MNGPELPKEIKGKSIGWWQKKCDAAMQELGKKKFPRSLLSGLPTEVMHHFFPKSVCGELRYNWDNLIPLTNGEHNRLHKSGDPSYEQDVIKIKGKKWYDELYKIRWQGTGKHFRQNIDYYREILAELKNELAKSK